ncbi:MAG: hypothetical protein CMJ83_02140 [Planctomycetes bacterium]|nr:hypothetical protein [Planctomycetota bacterium]
MTSTPRGALRAACVLLLFHGALFAPYVVRGEHYVPVSFQAVPPWMPTSGDALEETQDFGGTDKLVFCWPNLVRWDRAVENGDYGALLWNPDIFCGTPFQATQDTHAFYPGNFIYRWFGVLDGFLWSALIHGWIASFLAWLALTRVTSSPAALIGAAVYGGSGWFLAHHDIIPFIHAATWIPLVVWGTDRATAGRGLVGIAPIAIGLALSFYGGMPQITIIGLLGAGLLSACRASDVAWRTGAAAATRGLARAGVGVMIGCLLAAPQLLPGLEMRRLSGRSEIPLEELRSGAAKPWELTGIVLPGVIDHAPDLNAMMRDYGDTEDGRAIRDAFLTDGRPFLPKHAAGLTGNGDAFMERAFYPGMIAVVLLLLALLARPDGKTLAGLLLLLLGFLVAYGTPLLDVVYRLPGFSFGSIRRLLFLAVMGMSLLAAIGFDRWRALPRTRRALVASGVVVAPLLIGLVAALWMPSALLDSVGATGTDDPQGPVVEQWFVAQIWPAAALAGGALLGALVLRTRHVALATGGLLVLLAADGAWLNQRTNPGQVAQTPQPTPIVQWLQERVPPALHADPDGASRFRVVRYKNPATDAAGTSDDLAPLQPNILMAFGIPDVQGYEGLVNHRIEDLMERVEAGSAVAHHLVRELRRPESLSSPLLDLLSVRYVLSPAAALPGCERVPELPEAWLLAERMAVHERKTALPRLQTPASIEVLDDDDAILARMASPTFDPRQVVLIERSDFREQEKYLGLPSDWKRSKEPPKVTLVAYDATRIVIDYDAEEAAPLLIADTWHRGWALDDGGLVRADHALRMVVVPEGRGTLTLGFRPPSLRVGLLAGGGGLTLLLLTLVFGPRIGRSRSEP